MNKPDIQLHKWHSQSPKRRTGIPYHPCNASARCFLNAEVLRIAIFGFTYEHISFSILRLSQWRCRNIRATPCRWPSTFPTFRTTVMHSSLWRNETSLLTTVLGSWFALCECTTPINTANCISGYSQHGVQNLPYVAVP